jgi:hypothetical protein
VRPGWLACWIALLVAAPVSAQQSRVFAGYALADYREQAAFLRFRGSGPTAAVTIERGRLGLTLEGSHLALDPAGEEAGLESFTMDQIGARLAVRAMSLVALEAGYSRRSVAPGRAAESYSAATLGVRADYSLAPGADVGLRTAYVAGSDFSGGGSAPFGIELGLAASYGPSRSRFRLTGRYEFQRIDRHTDQEGTRLSVPIQSSVARLGVAVNF